jgi:Ca2+-binding RTX toxin-like protein
MVELSSGAFYPYNGTLVNLLNISVLPAVGTPVTGVISDDDGVLGSGTPSTITINGVTSQIDYIGSGTVSLSLLGVTLDSREIAAFSVDDQIYLYAPEGFSLAAGVVATFDITEDEPFALFDGAVDGLDTGQTMGLGYTDADGDQITSGNDTIFGNGGNDTISAAGGADLVSGGDGNDSISGNNGNDTIYGDAGNDTIIGGAGNDVLYGGDDDDSLSGGAGDDTIYGGAGNDTLDGGSGTNVVFGGDGDDYWVGGTGATGAAGSDTVTLGSGNDFAELGYFPTTGAVDSIDGGAGNDTISFDTAALNSFAIGITLNDTGAATPIGGWQTTFTNFENVRGNASNNALTGNSSDNQLLGLAGSDTLNGGAGNDTLDGGADNDTINGGDGNDRIIGGLGNDVLTGGNGSDTFVYTAGDGLDTISDFNTGDTSGTIGDSDNTNNDYIELSGFYDSIEELRNDFDDDGILNQSNFIGNGTGGTVDYSNNTAFGTGQGIVVTGVTSDVFTTDSTGVVCFARGTMIETLSGQVAIEDLQAGDMVKTMDRGYRPLSWIGGRKLDIVDLTQHPALCPIRITAGALGNGLPKKDLLVSPQHRVLVRSEVAKRMFGEHEVLIAANKLLTVDGIDIMVDTTEVEYFHMLFDQHEIVFSNGAATESLFTGPEAMKEVRAEARQEIASLFPELLEPEFTSAPVRFIPAKGKLMKKLAQRHQANGKPLFEA